MVDWVTPRRTMSLEKTADFLRRTCSSYFRSVGPCAMASSGPRRSVGGSLPTTAFA
jgi:hypothetical protein